jgi:hypothetical protein
MRESNEYKQENKGLTKRLTLIGQGEHGFLSRLELLDQLSF